MSQKSVPKESTSRMSMRIEGMHCASCVAKIEDALLKQDGVIVANVSLLDEKAVIEYEPSAVDRTVLEQAVESTGYRARRSTISMTLRGTTESLDWDEIRNTLETVEGVIHVRTFEDKNRTLIEYDDDLVTYKIVKKSLKNIGIEVEEAEGIEA
ncbi:MAG: cation transporter, partial [Candidatus Thorarchaeota archaeon]